MSLPAGVRASHEQKLPLRTSTGEPDPACEQTQSTLPRNVFARTRVTPGTSMYSHQVLLLATSSNSNILIEYKDSVDHVYDGREPESFFCDRVCAGSIVLCVFVVE